MQDPERALEAFTRKMKREGVPELVMEQFKSYLRQLFDPAQNTGLIPEESISPVRGEDLASQDELDDKDRDTGLERMRETVMIRLNGGLGTSMGMPYAKSLLTVRPGYTFLDLIRLQAEKAGFPLLLMDSFHTRDDVQAYWDRQNVPPQKRPQSFLQHKFPKILESMEPASCPEQPELEWNPPGHGDIYAALATSGILERLVQEGKRYAFISNSDNLGAVADPAILGYFIRKGCFFLMEVAQRQPQDKKGGHLALSEDGGFLLRETAQCPESDLSSFQDIERHCFFNTNNIWIDLLRLRDFIQQQGLPRLPLIVNPKTLDPRDESTPQVLQLETAMGAAISSFPDSCALRVTRHRFMPVKKTSDLLALRSDCYVLDQDYRLLPNPRRTLPPMQIELDPAHYKKVDDFEARFPYGPPSLLQCQSLSVSGDVCFGQNVCCKGSVEVVNNSSRQQMVPSEEVLSGRVELA